MFLNSVMRILAQADKQEAPKFLDLLRSPMVLLIVLLIVFYVFMIRNKRKEERTRKDMLGAIKKGDKVQTIGGILGTVVEAKETEVVLKVDEGSNTKMRFVRSAIHRVVEEEKAEKK